MTIKKLPKKMEKLKTAPRPQSILLTPMQDAYVSGVLDGTHPMDAAKAAGYAQPASTPGKLRNNEAVQSAIRAARDELSSATQISRADVIDGIMEAIGLARLAAEPATMIKGWSEVAKILGHYAPEVKKIEMSMGAKRLQSKYEAMTDQELLDIIDGTCVDVTEESQCHE